ncbi:LOW QUALITY PROTEIN: adenosine 5'-monophosphoramidase HINT3-like [Vespa velutina]|uniref:LOW QUALITY PROTEIN: adenosine 5'-monophosphoramidase HINT3-like n=1 Tax=Vespa velutina TaxID=202808 RepID=UPI001FB399C3|nr:LOW QUALITY PROTEIN: adenosine 5'-monophosphoramidase HINT3-like [Vespa velutina]
MDAEAQCIFCKIIRNESPSEKIYEASKVTCIKDIHPASDHHYLILPNKHIRNAKELKPADSKLCELTKLNLIIFKYGKTRLDTILPRTGFHWPPFNTVNHRTLHVISPVEICPLSNETMFKPNLCGSSTYVLTIN